MAAVRMVRKNVALLPWMRAAVFFVASLAAFAALPFYPPALRPLLALVCAALGLFAPAIGVLVLVVLLAIPLAAGDFLVGMLFLLVGLASVQFLGQDGARAFVVIALAFVATLVRAEWALAPLAGYALGASEGALASFAAVALIEAAGITLGAPSIGTLGAGGSGAGLVSAKELAALGDKALTFSWLSGAVSGLDVDAFLDSMRAVRDVPLLVAQPVLWGVAAALSGSLAKREAPVRSFLAIVGSSVALVLASVAVSGALGVKAAALGPTVAVSVLAAAVLGAVAIWGFPWTAVRAQGGLPSLATEDAEVDELLRMIANAEEALEDRHSSDATVLITDMKSFARMTQEQGTLATAKTVQKHRDLLLPIIRKAGGNGKSTGGDGLVASFSSPDDALKAAVAMQQALKRYNRDRTAGETHIRIGIASGDVILDRAGCPFLGDALNVAARVMSLADGDQVFSAAEVVDGSPDLPSPVFPHGEYSLKNITRPVAVYEVLWDQGQEPRRPQMEPPSAA